MNAQLIPLQPLSITERAAQALNREEAEREINALVEQSKSILSVTDSASREVCHQSMMDLKNLRIKIENKAEEGRAEAVAYSKAVIAIEKDLVKLLSPEEKRLKAIRDEWDTAKEREKELKIQQELARVERIQRRIEEIRSMPVHATGLDSLMLGQLLSKAESTVIDSAFFEEFTDKASEVLNVTCAALTGLLAKRKELDAEQERIRLEREELAKLRAEAAERDRLAKEAQAKADAEAKAERDRLEATAKAEREEQRRKDEAERKAEHDRQVAEAREHAAKLAAERAENARIAAERQAELDAQAEAQAAEQARIEATRAKLEAEQREREEAVRKAAEPKLEIPSPSGKTVVVMPDSGTVATTIKELIAALRGNPSGTWMANRYDNGFCDITVFDKDDKELQTIRNKA